MNDYWRKKKFLNSYKHCFEEYREIWIKKYDLLHPDPKGIDVSREKISSGSPTDLSDIYSKNEDMLEMLNGRLAVLREKMQAVRDAIENEEDETCRKILSFRYIDFMEFADIAEVMGYSVQYVYEKHKGAVDRLKYKEVFLDV